MASLEGTLLEVYQPRTVTLKSPRQGEDATPTIYGIKLLDETLNDTVSVESWRQNPWAGAIPATKIVVKGIKKLEFFAGKLRATV